MGPETGAFCFNVTSAPALETFDWGFGVSWKPILVRVPGWKSTLIWWISRWLGDGMGHFIIRPIVLHYILPRYIISSWKIITGRGSGNRICSPNRWLTVRPRTITTRWKIFSKSAAMSTNFVKVMYLPSRTRSCSAGLNPFKNRAMV